MEGDDEETISEEGLDAFVNFIIRPPRMLYNTNDLGPIHQVIENVPVMRRDFSVTNERNLNLQCSIWEPRTERTSSAACVIYLHGNASCRAEALALAPLILPYGLKLVSFDFSGSGHSEGQYISLGYFEKDDVVSVVDHILSNSMAAKVALWGHSMGAATALMYCGSPEAKPVACTVLDSGYASFEKLAEGVVENLPLPPGVPKKLLLSVGIRRVRKIVKSKADFDLNDIQPAKSAKKCSKVPCKIIHGTADAIVSYSHSEIIFKAYGCPEKELITIEDGQHEAQREASVESKAFVMLHKHLTDNSMEYLIALKGRATSLLLAGQYEDSISLFTQTIQEAEMIMKKKQSKDTPLSNNIASTFSEGNGEESLSKSGIFRLFQRKAGRPLDSTPRSSSNVTADPSPLATGTATAAHPATRNSMGLRRRRILSFGKGRRERNVQSSLSGLSNVSQTATTAATAPGRNSELNYSEPTALNGQYSAANGSSSREKELSSSNGDNTLEKEIGELKHLLATIYSNRSLARSKLENGDEALKDALRVLELDPTWTRGYQRQAAALRLIGDRDEAIVALEKGLAIEKDNKNLLELKSSIENENGSGIES